MLNMWEGGIPFFVFQEILDERYYSTLHARHCVGVGDRIEKTDTSPASPAHDVMGERNP